ATLNRITAAGSTQPLADLLAQLHRANPDDDTCILAARPLPAPVTGELLRRDITLDTVIAVRHDVEQRCAEAGLAGNGLYWFVVAVNEITTNAARHGGGSGEGSLRLARAPLRCRGGAPGPAVPVVTA